MRRNSAIFKHFYVSFRQIEQKFPAAWGKTIGKIRGKALAQLAADLIALSADTRAYGCYDIQRRDSGFCRKRNGARSYSRRGPAPAGMYCGTEAPPFVGDKHGNAIGCPHSEQNSAFRREQTVCGRIKIRPCHARAAITA